ncbi:MAG: acetyl-CoA carboxylase carboxyl transferase subunit beta [Epsilonproteobacteria bacterium]|nr:MAG: acetyl-CoA carboxylase carboxyl transferase subunit beta [Campylobacterota bacterium]RLA64938.1 MAG: acetyl-CoA carboxylase carboxyl transferase subunit beta [Campylobacterota bacterium]
MKGPKSSTEINGAGWFGAVKSPKLKTQKKQVSNTPVGMWKKCIGCGDIVQSSKLKENLSVCPYCDHHSRLSGYERLGLIIDAGSFQEWAANLRTKNPLKFVDKKPYDERLVAASEKTDLADSAICGLGTINGLPVSIGVMDFSFMGGSMGAVTGEKMAQAMEIALEKKIPAIIVSCSGGARMQEGLLSLMQMAKISGVRKKLRLAKVPYFSILTDPTTGGVAASFAMQGDINIAEPKALIGFAGPRVIEQSIRQILPEGFQRSEFLLEHGFLDRIVHRHDLKQELTFFIETFCPHLLPVVKTVENNPAL